MKKNKLKTKTRNPHLIFVKVLMLFGNVQSCFREQRQVLERSTRVAGTKTPLKFSFKRQQDVRR